MNGRSVAMVVLAVAVVMMASGPPPEAFVRLDASAIDTAAVACDRTAPGLSQAQVQAFLNGAKAGTAGDPQVNCLPAGRATWTSEVTWKAPANSVLLGAGSLTTLGGGDATIIIDGVNGTLASPECRCTNASLLSVTTNGALRIAGITIQGGAVSLTKNTGIVTITGTTSSLRLDHNHFDRRTYTDASNHKIVYLGGMLRGVADDNIFHLGQDIAWAFHFVNGTNDGNTQWSQPTAFGSSDFFFVEDNQAFADYCSGCTSGGAFVGAISDCQTGGKFVVRYNTLFATSLVQTHPTIHGADDRGCRGHESYRNIITSNLSGGRQPNFAMTYNNSGPGLEWQNDADNVFKSYIYLNNCREHADCGYTPIATPNNWGPCGTSFSGTASQWDRNDNSTGRPCIDQPGRGQGDLIRGTFPSKVNSTTKRITWPHQALEPIYEWLNTGNFVSGWGGSGYVNNGAKSVNQNVDYYLYRGNTNCAPGAGSCTAGVGAGTLAQRPPNCTTGAEPGGGVAWFATDQGSKNTETAAIHATHGSNHVVGADGVLYKCTATNTWTLYYEQYDYPHPLRNQNIALR